MYEGVAVGGLCTRGAVSNARDTSAGTRGWTGCVRALRMCKLMRGLGAEAAVEHQRGHPTQWSVRMHA